MDRTASLVQSADMDGLLELFRSARGEARCVTAKAIVWIRRPEAVSAHKAVLEDSSCGWKVRAEATWRLMEEKAPQLTEILSPYLEDESPELRWNVARVLGESGVAPGHDALTACLDDLNPHVLAWCQWGRCKLGSNARCIKPSMKTDAAEPK